MNDFLHFQCLVLAAAIINSSISNHVAVIDKNNSNFIVSRFE
jgi:hypothetical protein